MASGRGLAGLTYYSIGPDTMQIVLKKGESLTVRFTEDEMNEQKPIDMDGDFIITHGEDASICISTSWPDDTGRGGDDPIIYFVTAGQPEEGQMSVAEPHVPTMQELHEGEPF